jgi:signal transduction histidine kinase
MWLILPIQWVGASPINSDTTTLFRDTVVLNAHFDIRGYKKLFSENRNNSVRTRHLYITIRNDDTIARSIYLELVNRFSKDTLIAPKHLRVNKIKNTRNDAYEVILPTATTHTLRLDVEQNSLFPDYYLWIWDKTSRMRQEMTDVASIVIFVCVGVAFVAFMFFSIVVQNQKRRVWWWYLIYIITAFLIVAIRLRSGWFSEKFNNWVSFPTEEQLAGWLYVFNTFVVMMFIHEFFRIGNKWHLRAVVILFGIMLVVGATGFSATSNNPLLHNSYYQIFKICNIVAGGIMALLLGVAVTNLVRTFRIYLSRPDIHRSINEEYPQYVNQAAVFVAFIPLLTVATIKILEYTTGLPKSFFEQINTGVFVYPNTLYISSYFVFFIYFNMAVVSLLFVKQNIRQVRKRGEQVVKLRELTQRRQQELRDFNLSLQQERKRLAMDIHDGLQGGLTQMIWGLKKLKNEQPDVSLDPLIQRAETNLKDARIIYRNIIADELLKEEGFISAITGLIDNYHQMCPDLEFEFTCTAQDRTWLNKMDKHVIVNSYYITQTLLQNVVAYSKATEAYIHLYINDDSKVVIIVEDNGIGFDPQNTPAGVGRKTIENRITPFEGELFIESAPGEGTRITVLLPTKFAI